MDLSRASFGSLAASCLLIGADGSLRAGDASNLQCAGPDTDPYSDGVTEAVTVEFDDVGSFESPFEVSALHIGQGVQIR